MKTALHSIVQDALKVRVGYVGHPQGDFEPFEGVPLQQEKPIERLETPNFCDLRLKTT